MAKLNPAQEISANPLKEAVNITKSFWTDSASISFQVDWSGNPIQSNRRGVP